MSGDGAGTHSLTEYGTTRCPVQRVAANVDSDGECSACGAPVAECATCRAVASHPHLHCQEHPFSSRPWPTT